jgi:phosphoribosylamine--glycine ligase
MKILVIGGGGREHAIIRALLKSPEVCEVVASPGNAGIAQDVLCVPLPNLRDMLDYCRREKVELVVIGPEKPLVDGWADALREAGVPVFGPSAAAAQLEGSKAFTKALCDRYKIPTAAYGAFTHKAEALAYLAAHPAPIVVKADGLAAGKGVVVAMSDEEARDAVMSCFEGAFGEAGQKVVIEEFLEGEEASLFALCDGERALLFGSAQDHKRVGEGDTGPNTGGMGSYSPAPVMTNAMNTRVMREIIEPTVAGLKRDGMPFIGVLFAGLMLTKTGPKLIEYNCRFGDPETQSLMSRFDGELAKLLYSCAAGKLEPKHHSLSKQHALCVVMAANGYPGAVEKGSVIRGLSDAAAVPGVAVYHAGTVLEGAEWRANGGRVLGVTALGESLKQAHDRAYSAVDAIDWRGGFCRRDIGWRALGKQTKAG